MSSQLRKLLYAINQKNNKDISAKYNFMTT